MADDGDVLLTPAQTAAMLQVHPSTLRRWRAQRTGPPWVKVGQTYRYWRSEIIRWLDENRPDGGPAHRGG